MALPRRVQSLTLLLLTLVACLLLTAPLGVRAEQSADDVSRWMPALALMGGMSSQKARASTTSPQREESATGSSRLVYADLGLNAELMSPGIEALPGQPRLFVHAGLFFSFDAEHHVAREGVPRTPFYPDTFFILPANAAQGVGQSTSSEAGNLSFSAGLGVAVHLPFQGRTLRVKPYVAYLRDELSLRSRVSDAESIADDSLCPCRTAALLQRNDEVYHSIGPALELEIDAARAGPIMVTLFARAEGLATLGDRETKFGTTGTYDDGTTPISVESVYIRDRWTYRGSLGFRLRWMPLAPTR